MKSTTDKPPPPHKFSKSLLPTPLKPHATSSPLHAPLPAWPALHPGMPLNSAKQWENPLSPRPRPLPAPPPASLPWRVTSRPQGPSPAPWRCCGFMFFFYDVSVPGITLDFKGLVMILPGTSAYATLREAHQAVAQQVLQKICNN
ncbi:hypothetical protein F7725_009545 [Dissostichus mawsoni]|uniref:Uncharacterized protein n=1 Tax=Dissostichus mawsoni TaxID=36200 RepID=A0A7J5XMF2_DISMA|nr:hypothetical protein F7725_009545 [Dissostichus mawsoni]